MSGFPVNQIMRRIEIIELKYDAKRIIYSYCKDLCLGYGTGSTVVA